MERVGVSAGFLKIVAVVTMFIDHVGASVLLRMIYLGQRSLGGMNLITLYRVTRNIGRVAFPIFCFFLVEGFFKTRSRGKYLARLLLFALIAEYPFDLAMQSGFSMTYQNTLFELALGFAAIWAMEACRKVPNLIAEWGLKAIIFVGAYFLAEKWGFDYGKHGIVSIVVLYLFYSYRELQLLAGAVTFLWEIYAVLAFPLLVLYNGKKGSCPKHFFYVFYPVHLLIIYTVCVLTGISVIPAV